MTGAITLRPARDDDAETIIRVVSRCWAEYPGCVTDIDNEAPELRALATHMQGKGGAAFVAERDGAVRSLTAVWPDADGGWEIGKMYCAAEMRGTSAAPGLLLLAEQFARAQGGRELRLWSDTRFTRAHAFYEKHGFLRTGPIRALGDRSNSVEFGYWKPLNDVVVRALNVAAAASAERALADILVACVDSGAAVSFLPPLSRDVARAFWHRCTGGVAAGRRILVVAWLDGRLAGVVTVDCDTPPNQPHRADLQKLLVRPDARRRGVARALVAAAEREALQAGRTLLTLDTREGDLAEPLYRSLGYNEAGRIPGYALNPDGTSHATVLFYKSLA